MQTSSFIPAPVNVPTPRSASTVVPHTSSINASIQAREQVKRSRPSPAVRAVRRGVQYTTSNSSTKTDLSDEDRDIAYHANVVKIAKENQAKNDETKVVKAITVGRASQISKLSEKTMSDRLRRRFQNAGVKITPKARKYFVSLLKEHATDPTVSIARARNIIKHEINLHGAAKIGKTQAQTLKATTLGGQVKGRNVSGEHANFHFSGGIKRTN